MWSASFSARPDSLSPQVRSVRDRMTATVPARRARSGRMAPRHDLLHLVRHARHGVDRPCRPPGRSGPGAVPGCGSAMAVAPSGTSAWRRLLAGMRRPRAANRSRMRSAASSSVTRRDAHDRGDGVAGDVVLRRPQAAAHDHGVGPAERQLERGRRSGRGCRPPPARGCGRCRRAPAARPARPSWCRRSGRAAARCPTATTSQRTVAPRCRARRRRRQAGPRPRRWPGCPRSGTGPR